jgi:hypothetical protein
MATKFWSAENVNEKDCMGDLGVDSRMILKWILGK